jgi:hypothetical protein
LAAIRNVSQVGGDFLPVREPRKSLQDHHVSSTLKKSPRTLDFSGHRAKPLRLMVIVYF